MNRTRIRTFGGHLAAISVGVLVAVTVLSGTAYAPPQTKSVNIADSQEPNNVANVSADGALEVEGTVMGQVDIGNLPAVQRVTSQDDPGRVAYGRDEPWSSLSTARFVVPARKRLVITYVSGFFQNSDGNGKGDDVLSVTLTTGEPQFVRHDFVPTFTGHAGLSHLKEDVYVFSEQTHIYADGDFHVAPRLGPGVAAATQVFGRVSVSGYLIDCSRSAPNCN